MAGRTRIIDLSVPLMNYSMDTHEQTIHYLDHAEVARQRAKTYDIPADRFPVPHVHTASEVVTLTTHAGTHVDAPWHYGPLSEGRPARTIDEIPLEWCYGDGVVLDFTAKHADELILPGDIDAALGRIGHRLQPLDIVLIRTGCDRFFDQPDWSRRHPGMSREATLHLIDQGIRMMGTDGWGFDIPIPTMVERLRGGDPAAFFPAHYAGRDREYCHIEKMANLGAIPRPTGFKVACFPVKVHRGSGGWCRAVAILEE